MLPGGERESPPWYWCGWFLARNSDHDSIGYLPWLDSSHVVGGWLVLVLLLVHVVALPKCCPTITPLYGLLVVLESLRGYWLASYAVHYSVQMLLPLRDKVATHNWNLRVCDEISSSPSAYGYRVERKSLSSNVVGGRRDVCLGTAVGLSVCLSINFSDQSS